MQINVTKTRQLNLCLSCELCRAVCPANAITMEYKFGQFLPKVNEKNCSKCGYCLELCPGIDLDPLNLINEKDPNDLIMGTCLECCTAHSNNYVIRKNSASGGLVTNLVSELIRNKDFDAVFIVDFNKFGGEPVRLKAANDIDEILKSGKSKYIPVSIYNVIKTLQKDDEKRYIIVGTPCQIYGIKKFIKKFKFRKENLLFLGLFCDKTMNFNIIRYFEDKYKKQNENLTKLEFRTKDKDGWPGHPKLFFDSGRKLIVDRCRRTEIKKFFQLNRCLFCFDKLNRFADISFGDCYVNGKGSFYGKSSVIIRTSRGEKFFLKYSNLFTIEKESLKKIAESQHLADKKVNLEYAKLLTKTHNLYPKNELEYEVEVKVVKNLPLLQKYVKWGMNYNNRIRCNLFLSKFRKKLGFAKKLLIYGIAFASNFAADIFHSTSKSNKGGGQKNIIIVGGQLFNKGAQAMTFTVVDQLKKKFPDKNIYLFSEVDFDRDEEEKIKYNFEILPWNPLKFLAFQGKYFGKKSNYYLRPIIDEVIKDAYFFVDISGYALSSQFSFQSNISHLLNIATAKKHSIPYYIFPQSIGPFSYPLKLNVLLSPLLYIYLKYPKKIFAREKEGVNSVRKFTKNVEKNYDIVLQNKNYDISNIYKENIQLRNIKIKPNSVGIIPNLKVIERSFSNDIYSIYVQLINTLVDAEKNVYIVRHSYEDLDICEKIKSFFLNNKKVKIISADLNAFELENVITKFEFVIASRYHSVIHAYKNGVPALVIGWATKYLELLESFDQFDYFFDIRKKIDVETMRNKLKEMMHNYIFERGKITNKINKIQKKESVFNIF